MSQHRQDHTQMAKNLSRMTRARPIHDFYTDIHVSMIDAESAGDTPRPTLREFSEALERFAIPPGRALDAGCGATVSFAAACVRHGFGQVHAMDFNLRSLR